MSLSKKKAGKRRKEENFQIVIRLHLFQPFEVSYMNYIINVIPISNIKIS